MNWYVAKLVFRVISGNGDHNASLMSNYAL
jgi:hypothetical protein